MDEYLLIAQWLRDRIETGALPPGDRVPTVSELRRLFDVSERAARMAVDELKREDLIVTERGRGTFARETRPVQRLVFGDDIPGQPFWPTGLDRDVKILDTHGFTGRAYLDVANALGIPPGSPVRIHHTYYAVSRREIQMAITYRPTHVSDDVELVQFRDELRVRLPNSPERDRMELTIAAPVIDIIRTSYAANDQPVALTCMVLDARAYILEYRHPVTNGSAALGTRARR
jgi:GntR family transcriptional regulator